MKPVILLMCLLPTALIAKYHSNLYDDIIENHFSDFLDDNIDDYEEEFKDASEISFDENDLSIFDKQKKCKRDPEYQYTKLDCVVTIQTIQCIVNFFIANIDIMIYRWFVWYAFCPGHFRIYFKTP